MPLGQVELCNVSCAVADYDNRTPLMVAAAEGHAGVVRILLSAKDTNTAAVDRYSSVILCIVCVFMRCVLYNL